MARVSEQFLEAYAPLSMKELKDPIVFVVDMIEGFVHTGALHDEAIPPSGSPKNQRVTPK